jgi:hypothetical protein
MNKSKRYNKTRKIKRNKSRTKKRGGMISRFFSRKETPVQTITIQKNKIFNGALISQMFASEVYKLNIKLKEKYENSIILKKKGLPDRILVNGKISSNGFTIEFITEKNIEKINIIDYDRIVLSFPQRLDIPAEDAEDFLYPQGKEFLKSEYIVNNNKNNNKNDP